jgi:hypothetical protein
MIESGLFRHYKGNLYRVLFIAPWWSGQDQLKADDRLDVVAYDDSVGVRWHDTSNSTIFEARWSGNDFIRLDVDDPIVIYVALYDDGRVAARPLKEFEESVDVPCPAPQAHNTPFAGVDRVPRFERIGE